MWCSKHDYNVPPAPPRPGANDDGCTIGWTDDERTMLKVTSGYTTLSLIMTEVGVRRMIRQLEATLPEKELSETNKE